MWLTLKEYKGWCMFHHLTGCKYNGTLLLRPQPKYTIMSKWLLGLIGFEGELMASIFSSDDWKLLGEKVLMKAQKHVLSQIRQKKLNWHKWTQDQRQQQRMAIAEDRNLQTDFRGCKVCPLQLCPLGVAKLIGRGEVLVAEVVQNVTRFHVLDCKSTFHIEDSIRWHTPRTKTLTEDESKEVVDGNTSLLKLHLTTHIKSSFRYLLGHPYGIITIQILPHMLHHLPDPLCQDNVYKRPQRKVGSFAHSSTGILPSYRTCYIISRIHYAKIMCISVPKGRYGASPFGYALGESGVSWQLAIINGQIKWPAGSKPPYPEAHHQFVSWILQPQATVRTCIDDIIIHVDKLIAN
ncbi:phosphorylase kinase, gamma catalytic subunit [Artemisia annua]|uniref:non-specific serine/threonine protein kinase n=1 Tax=Artemisia annua TaxID=35608 RepID=A0A2U1Q921_ARTAN|nr:phosphorylase kinase, gamma catalytic subunit [Artemisia annua]